MGSYLVRIAEAKYLVGDDEAAVRFALRALAQPELPMVTLCGSHRGTGTIGIGEDEAHRYLAEVTRMRPDFSMTFVRTMHPFSPRHGNRSLLRGTPQAGVPEGAA